MQILDLTVRLALVMVLAAAVVGKLRTAQSRRDYAGMVTAMGVPAALVRPVGVALIGAEAATAALLVGPATAPVGALAAVLLFAALTVGVYQVVHTKRRVKCNCFGGSDRAELSTVHLVRNVALVALSVVALALSLGSGGPGIPEMAVASFGALVIAAVVVRIDDLVSLFR